MLLGKLNGILIATPDVLQYDLKTGDFLVLSSDGLFEHFWKQEDVCNFLRPRLTEPYFGAKSASETAVNGWADDNTTTLVVKMQTGIPQRSPQSSPQQQIRSRKFT